MVDSRLVPGGWIGQSRLHTLEVGIDQMCARIFVVPLWHPDLPGAEMSKDLVIVVVDFPTLDLFAGAGGLSQGMASAGLTVVGASEMDNDALETYKSSHLSRLPQSSLELFEGDIGRHSFRSLKGEIAVVAGGPPCQPYSLGGLRRGVADDRDGIPQFVRVVSEVMPEAFLMENVPGLARGTQLPVLKRAIEKFRELGFLVTWKILHAADFGVSQRRQRLFVVGTRESNFKWPKPTHGADASRSWVAAREVLDASRPIGDLNNAIITYAKSPDLRPSPWDGHLWNGGGRPINPDGLVPTLLASMGGNKTPWLDGDNIVPDYHAYLLAGGAPRRGIVAGARRLTYQEAAMVQGFSLDMSWRGGRSSIYRQIGNAVPVPLAKAVGSALVKAMARTEDSIKPRGLAVL